MPHTASNATPSYPASSHNTNSLANDIEKHVRLYFTALGDNHLHEPSDLYELMLSEFEKPLLTVVSEHTKGNQSRMAEILGLNRGTLRKKLKQHRLIA